VKKIIDKLEVVVCFSLVTIVAALALYWLT
jgi:hypothetical protein